MKCPQSNEKLVDFLYGDLSSVERHNLEVHLKSCKRCQRQLEQYQFVRTSFQKIKTEEPQSLVHQKILTQAKERVLEESKSWFTRFLFNPATATAAAVILAAGIFLYSRQFVPLENMTEQITVKAPQEEILEERDARTGTRMITGIPSDRIFSSPERLVASVRPSTALTRNVSQNTPSMWRTFTEDAAPPFESPLSLKDSLYAFELGNLYFSQGEFENAIATYSLALSMNPRKEYTRTISYQLALSYKNLNDCNSAVKVFDDIEQKDPQHPDIDKVMIMAGDCYMDLKAYDKAETHYNDFLRRFPDRESQVADKLEVAKEFRRVNLSY